MQENARCQNGEEIKISDSKSISKCAIACRKNHETTMFRSGPMLKWFNGKKVANVRGQICVCVRGVNPETCDISSSGGMHLYKVISTSGNFIVFFCITVIRT